MKILNGFLNWIYEDIFNAILVGLLFSGIMVSCMLYWTDNVSNFLLFSLTETLKLFCSL